MWLLLHIRTCPTGLVEALKAHSHEIVTLHSDDRVRFVAKFATVLKQRHLSR